MSRILKHRTMRLSAWCAALLSCLLPIGDALAAPPTVNGLFYGDGDHTRYIHWDTSYYGSKLYIYLDVPSTTLYVALVVDRSVNDNVFGESHGGYAGNYMGSAGWGQGGGQQRSAAALVNSEFASFEFACETGSQIWAWQQGYGCENGGTWVSDSTCGTSAVLTTGYPPTLQSASSFARNINTYNANTSPQWDLFFFGTTLGNWKSPFSFTDPNTDPANNPNTVIGLDGYPAPTSTGDLSLGPPITYSGTHAWEWSMIYEWSIDLGVAGTNCSTNSLFLVSGASHHSPMKDGVAGDFDPECGEENDCFPPGGGEDPLSDFGDLPDAYGTVKASTGAQHYITVAGPYLGAALEVELDGFPSSDATGDGDEEDGVTVNVGSNWTVGSSQTVSVEVANASSGALLGAWFDWNGDGDFGDAGEFFSWTVSEGTNVLDLVVGAGYDWLNDDLYARFRIFSSAAEAPGGSLSQADSIGIATDGEVEDYTFEAGSNPVTLNAFASELVGSGVLAARWQTASETDNVGFELWGLVHGQWQPLGDIVASRSMNSALPQNYEVEVAAPDGLAQVKLVDYDTRGRAEQFGPFALGESHGEVQPEQRVDWSAPRARRAQRLEERGFVATGGRGAAQVEGEPGARVGWKKLERGAPIRGAAAHAYGSTARSIAAPSRGGKAPEDSTRTIRVESGPSTHVAVAEAGVQRVTYEVLRDGGLDLAGVRSGDIAVTWRGEPVARWIDGPAVFGPGSAIEFLGHPPQGDDALYVDTALYQVSVDRLRARAARQIGRGAVNRVSTAYRHTHGVDRPRTFHSQSPTGDPWIERPLLVRGKRPSTLTLDLPLNGPVLAGQSRLILGLGTISDLPDLTDTGGAAIPEHNVEVRFAGPDGAFHWVTAASASGQQDWTIEADLPPGLLATGLNRVQLRFSTAYFFSLVVVDRYGVEYPAPYVGPTLDFAPDSTAQGYTVQGFDHPAVVVYAEERDGALTRIEPRVSATAGGYAADIRPWDAERFWVTDLPHAPDVFTTQAPDDLLAGPADLVVIAGSSFVGTSALDEYLAQAAGFDPMVVDVEDIYNSVGFGMALPAAITDYLAARHAVNPFTHVQLVGTDCYDRLNHVSSCLSFLPLPTAAVGPTLYSPSHNRLVDFDGDGVGDVAVAQFSVRDETELARIVRKGESWRSSGLSGTPSALLIAEESHGRHSFIGQIERLNRRLAWSDTDLLDMSRHSHVATARAALASSLDTGRAVTVFSGHSSPTVWAFRGLLTAGSVSSLTNTGLPTVMVPLACETTYDISPNANVLGHQLLYAGDHGALAISGAVALSNLSDNEHMARYVFDGLKNGLTLGQAVQEGRRALGSAFQTLQDNWMTQGDVTIRLEH